MPSFVFLPEILSFRLAPHKGARSAKLALLSEIYWRNSAEPREPNCFAGDVGFKYHLIEHLDLHAAIGKSLRDANRGGPDLRVYAGIKLDF